MPGTVVDLLKSTDYWEIPYRYDHPTGIQLMEGALPEEYNMLHKSYVDVKSSLSDFDDDVDFDFDPEENDENEKRDELEDQEEEEEKVIGQKEDENEMLEEEEEVEGDKHQKWKISKVVGRRMTYIHIKQAIKLLLPREYIARGRQKRHWAAKCLPGKSPLDPTHDVVRYSHVALKSVIKEEGV